MLKGEKFEKKIKEFNYRFAMKDNTLLVCCDDIECRECGFSREISNSSCAVNRFRWLLEEYKEPILTDEGKDFLKQMIAPFELNEVTSVVKGDTNFYIYFGSHCTVYDNETLEEKMKLFKKMNDCKDYTLEELGLCLKNQQD